MICFCNRGNRDQFYLTRSKLPAEGGLQPYSICFLEVCTFYFHYYYFWAKMLYYSLSDKYFACAEVGRGITLEFKELQGGWEKFSLIYKPVHKFFTCHAAIVAGSTRHLQILTIIIVNYVISGCNNSHCFYKRIIYM